MTQSPIRSPQGSVARFAIFCVRLTSGRGQGSAACHPSARRHEEAMRLRSRSLRLRIAALALAGMAAAMLPLLSAGPAAAAGTNLALGKTVSVSSANGQYVATNINDGNQGSYWESASTFPQWAQVDLGTSTSISQVVFKLPTGWSARNETLSVQGSTDGTNFSTIVASASHAFDPNSANTVSISFGATTTRYVRANITANTGWGAAQVSEF